MSLQSTFSNTFHLRDFVDTVTDDPSRENASNYVEIQTDANIFEESSFYSPNVNVEPIRTRIHAYLTREERDLYVPNAFFYADGRFSTTLSTDGPLEISVQALSLMRHVPHPGDVSDFDKYRRHLPEQWCPMVTIIGFVPSRNDKPPDLPEARYFAVETSVYDTSKAASVAFSVTCFLENTKRWQRVKIPPAGAFLSITAKVAGRTVDANQLALRVLDLAYLPRPASVPTATPTPSSTPTSKRSARWEGRATPFTPSKRRRGSDSASLAESSYKNQLPQSTEGRSHVSISEDSPDSPANSPSNSPSPSTMANTGESSITLHPFPGSDRETRPHRNRHPPKKYPHKE
ncbi:5'-deoxyadenosine deaminase [Fusarium oxysporum f. sp. albedinis]|nr:5'-deoxyadenosine deaminase [Fusarium oxysporum f. sp. albedinis]